MKFSELNKLDLRQLGGYLEATIDLLSIANTLMLRGYAFAFGGKGSAVVSIHYKGFKASALVTIDGCEDD